MNFKLNDIVLGTDINYYIINERPENHVGHWALTLEINDLDFDDRRKLITDIFQ